MKSVKPGELERLSRLDPAVRFILLTGPDDATMESVAAHLIALAGKEAERVDLTSNQMAQDGALLAAEAASMSLFSPARVIRLEISGGGDDCLAAVEALLGADSVLNPVIATGASVTARSKLVKLVEGANHAVAAICYQPDRRALVGIAMEAAAAQGLRVANAEAQLLVDLVSGDQALMRREIEKIALYLDAGPGRSRPPTSPRWAPRRMKRMSARASTSRSAASCAICPTCWPRRRRSALPRSASSARWRSARCSSPSCAPRSMPARTRRPSSRRKAAAYSGKNAMR